MISLFNINNYQIDTAQFSNLLHDSIVEEFEQEFADYVGAKYACSANSATSLIFLALLNVQDMINIPSLIPSAVPNVIVNAGNKVCFYDDVSWVGHSYILYNYNDYNYKLVDSAQQVHRDIFKDKANLEDLMVFSFYPTKPVGGCDGGMIVSDDKEKIDWFRLATLNGEELTVNSWERNPIFPGWKMNMNAIQAYMARENLRKLDSKTERLTEIRQIYNSKFNMKNTSSHLYRLNIEDNVDFVKKMKNKKISCGIHYRPCHLNTIYDDHSCHIISGLPKSEEDGSTTVSIPFHEKLTGQEIDYIIEQVYENIN